MGVGGSGGKGTCEKMKGWMEVGEWIKEGIGWERGSRVERGMGK